MPKLRLKSPASEVADYFHLFVNRRAYALQPNRPRPESTRHYSYRPKDKKTGQGPSLTLDTIRRHIEGGITIGLYSINPDTQCSKWVAIDADCEDCSRISSSSASTSSRAVWSWPLRTAIGAGISG